MENLDKALASVGESVVAEIRKLAKKDNFEASGDLDKSISYTVKGNIVEVSANRYIEAISGGIKRQNGSKSEFEQKVSNIKQWAKQKGIRGRDSKGKYISAEKMAIGIAFSIRSKGISERFGYKGSGFLDEMREGMVERVTEMIAEAYKLDIIVKLKEI
tara:strand:+ start:298 stop:774 length:477 start_codon:yes stop_codon:yes gene_type:complete